MNAKWFFSTFLILLAFFGVFHEEVSAPNQEIILEFVDVEVPENDVQKAIENVKQQLLDVGVTNIKVQEAKNGTLKISYYSTVTVDNIKEALSLSNENDLVLNSTSKKQKDHSNSSSELSEYNLDIYELNKGTDISGFDGKYVLEIKSDIDRLSNPNSYVSSGHITIDKTDQLFKTAYRVNKYVVITIDNTSHKEPEVRAGPIS